MEQGAVRDHTVSHFEHVRALTFTQAGQTLSPPRGFTLRNSTRSTQRTEEARGLRWFKIWLAVQLWHIEHLNY